MTMNFENQQIGGYQLRIARVHQGERPTLLLTNAFPQSIRCWESLWDRLAQHYNLLAVDLAGFGMSEGSAEVMRPSAQAELLVQLMDQLGINSVFVVGPDIGMPVALWLATEHPDRVSGVNVYDGPATWPTDFDPALGSAVRHSLVRWLGTRWPMRGYLMKQNYAAASNLGYHHFKPSDAVLQEYQDICFDKKKHQYAFDYLGSYHQELPLLESRLSSLATPVLITWGAHDQFVRPSNAKTLHEQLKNSELQIFENAGHFSHEDADELWLDALVTFTRKHQKQHAETSSESLPC